MLIANNGSNKDQKLGKFLTAMQLPENEELFDDFLRNHQDIPTFLRFLFNFICVSEDIESEEVERGKLISERIGSEANKYANIIETFINDSEDKTQYKTRVLQELIEKRFTIWEMLKGTSERITGEAIVRKGENPGIHSRKGIISANIGTTSYEERMKNACEWLELNRDTIPENLSYDYFEIQILSREVFTRGFHKIAGSDAPEKRKYFLYFLSRELEQYFSIKKGFKNAKPRLIHLMCTDRSKKGGVSELIDSFIEGRLCNPERIGELATYIYRGFIGDDDVEDLQTVGVEKNDGKTRGIQNETISDDIASQWLGGFSIQRTKADTSSMDNAWPVPRRFKK